jgi:hypothetical protein
MRIESVWLPPRAIRGSRRGRLVPVAAVLVAMTRPGAVTPQPSRPVVASTPVAAVRARSVPGVAVQSCRRLLCASAVMLLALPSQAQVRVEAVAQPRMKANAAAVDVRRETSSAAAAALIPGPVNDGEAFQLICRGGPGLRIRLSEPWMAQAAGDLPGGIRFRLVSTMTVDFNRSPQPPDRSGRNLQPGQCSPADFQLGDSAPVQIRDVVDVGDTWGDSPDVAESIPRAGNIPRYLGDPDHYWSFPASDSGSGYFASRNSRHWKPGFHKGPAPSTTYRPATAAAVSSGAPAMTTTLATSPRFGAIVTGKEGHAGTPTPPSPAPPPIIAGPVVFNPPLLEDGAQLWACADAAAGEADPEACSGEQSAQAYCRLREALSGPDLVIADAQPGVPVRAVNGDACIADACRVVVELQCDH